jgi:RND family efflux transporter MFP subunit
VEFKRFSKIQIIAFALMFAGALGLWFEREYVSQLFAQSYDDGKSKKNKKKKKRKVPVIVKYVKQQTDVVRIAAIGTARAKRFVTIYPQASGEIIDFMVVAGERVKNKQPILKLESRKARIANRLAEKKLKEARRLLTRSKRLRSSRVNSLANVEDAETVYERAQLELEQTREALNDRTIEAPFAGIVGIPKVEKGDRITPATEIITIDNRDTLIVEFEVAERYLSRLKIGHPVHAVTPTFPDKTIKGTIENLDSRVDPVSRTIRIRAAFSNKDDSLLPGVSFFIKLDLPGKMFPMVPQLALQWGEGKSFVWRVTEKKKVEKVIVRLVNRLNNTILIDGDIAPGDLVVVEGVQRLREGRRVVFKKPKRPPVPGS